MTEKSSIKSKPVQEVPRLFVEATSEGTHQGKSTILQRTRDLFDDIGLPNVLVRVESRRVAGPLREGDVAIATEDLALAETTPGGVVGVLRPGLLQLDRIASEGGVVLWDWPGGFGQQRQEVLVRANLDALLTKRGIKAMTLVMTTNVIDRIAEAQSILEVTRDIAPSFQRVLIRNEYVGRFAFASDSAPYRSLKAAEAAATFPGITLNKISDVSLAALRPCQRRSDSRPAWRSKSRPLAAREDDMQRAPIGALCISSRSFLISSG